MSPAATLSRPDGIITATVAALSAVLYATTFSSHVALGDGPESVAGVKTLGILHAPGYPSYVLAARLFGAIVAIGSWSLRTNLFSLVCATATVAVVFLVARLFGASRAGAAIGALALASTASFWLNATFAKHYAWTGLLLALPILFTALWQEGRSEWWLVGAAFAVGAEVGSGWQLAAIVVLGLVVMVTLGERSPSNRALLLTGGTFVVVVVGLAAFVTVRAGQDPTLNWGGATNLSRLITLASRGDFQGVHAGAGATTTFLGRFAGRTAGVVRDVGWFAAAFALVGAVAWRRMRRDQAVFLLLAGAANLVAVAIDQTVGKIEGFLTVIVQGGYMLLTMIVVAVLVALGTTVTIEWVTTRVSGHRDDVAPGTRWMLAVIAVLVAAVVVGPSIAVHRAHADLRVPNFADAYGKQVLAALPPHAVLLVWNEEYEMPMIKRQLVDGDRRDVTVIAANAVRLTWARDQIARRLHLGNALNQSDLQLQIVYLAATLLRHRPVYLDPEAMFELQNLVGFEPEGVVAKVVRGAPGTHRVADVATRSAQLEATDRADGLTNQSHNRFPVGTVYFLHERAHIELAKAYALARDRNGTLRELQRALALEPGDFTLPPLIRRVRQVSPASLFSTVAHE